MKVESYDKPIEKFRIENISKRSLHCLFFCKYSRRDKTSRR